MESTRYKFLTVVFISLIVLLLAGCHSRLSWSLKTALLPSPSPTKG